MYSKTIYETKKLSLVIDDSLGFFHTNTGHIHDIMYPCTNTTAHESIQYTVDM